MGALLLRARADPDLGPTRGPARLLPGGRCAQAPGACSAALPATGIGSLRPGKASSARMTFDAESPILLTERELERSWRALLEAESMGVVSVSRGRPPGLAVSEGQSSQST